jgi:hypothetical protein
VYPSIPLSKTVKKKVQRRKPVLDVYEPVAKELWPHGPPKNAECPGVEASQ